MITNLKPNQIFVFGSNLGGRHGKGAALLARVKFGAVYGVGEGFTGQTWAFPTLTADLSKVSLDSLLKSRERLYAACKENPTLEFLLTKVGCGLAGFPEELMRDLFSMSPANLVLPSDWV